MALARDAGSMAGAWFRREGGRLRRDDVVAAAAIQSWILNTSTVWPLRGPTGEGALFLAVLVADPCYERTVKWAQTKLGD